MYLEDASHCKCEQASHLFAQRKFVWLCPSVRFGILYMQHESNTRLCMAIVLYFSFILLVHQRAHAQPTMAYIVLVRYVCVILYMHEWTIISNHVTRTWKCLERKLPKVAVDRLALIRLCHMVLLQWRYSHKEVIWYSETIAGAKSTGCFLS